MIKYSSASDVEELLRDILDILSDYFNHVRIDRVRVVRSHGSRTHALARIHGLPSIWRYVLGVEPMYVIEVVSENFDKLDRGEKVRVLIHELLHIPKRFSGGLRPHGRYVNRRVIERLYRIYCSRRQHFI